MASFESFVADNKKTPEESEFDETNDGEELLYEQDIKDALDLLNKCMHLLAYMADTDSCASVTKRERESMYRVSELVRTFLDDVKPHYEDEE